MATIAAMTRRQVNQPAPDVTETELSASASVADGDSRDEENVPVSDLSGYQKPCVAAYAKDPVFQDESLFSQYTNRHGLCWAPGDKLVISDADDLRQDVLREMHDSPYSGLFSVKKTSKAIEPVVHLAIFER